MVNNKNISRGLAQWMLWVAVLLVAVPSYGATAKSYFVAGHSGFQALVRDENMAGERGNWEKVIRSFLECYEAGFDSPYGPKAMYYLGRTYDEMGHRSGNSLDLNFALKYYGDFVERYPRHGWADDCLYRRAAVYARQGEKDRAEHEYRRLVTEYPQSDRRAAALAVVSGVSSGQTPQSKSFQPRPSEAKPEPQGLSTVSLEPTHAEKPSPVQLYESLYKSVYMIIAINAREKTSQGSGVAVSERVMISNHHVVRGMDAFGYIQGDDGVLLKAIDGSKKKDILVARSTRNLTPIKGFRSFDSLKIGEKVYTLGAPESWNNTFSEGIISGLRKWGGVRYIQTTAPISHGSSGGGLFDDYGRLIGITTLSHKEGQNLNLAISVDEYMPYISDHLH